MDESVLVSGGFGLTPRLCIGYFGKMDKINPPAPQSARCIRNDGYPVALEVGRTYLTLPDGLGETYGLVRVIDESGESALYPREYFRFDG